MESELGLLERMRALRKRRSFYQSDAEARKQIERFRSFLPAETLERCVFERAEVEGWAYKSIADELNVSQRQLYRIRNRMINMIAAGEAQGRRLWNGGRAADLEMLQTLLKYGQVDAAVASLRLIREAALSAEEEVTALSLEARIATDRGDREGARRAAAAAEQRASAVQGPERARAYRSVAMARAYAAYISDVAYEEAIALCESALNAAAPPVLTPREAVLLVRDLIFLGMLHQESANPQRAIEVLDRAERLLQNNRDCPELAMIHVHRAFAYASLVGGMETALEQAQRALCISLNLSAPFELVWANIALGMLKDVSGKARGALAGMRSAVETARSFFSGDPLIRTHFHAARIDMTAGFAAEALDRIDGVRPHLLPQTLLTMHFSLVSARLHNARGDFREGERWATMAIDGFEQRTRSTHFIGLAYYVRAASRRALGIDARRDAECAVSFLRRGGYVADHERGLQLLAELTS